MTDKNLPARTLRSIIALPGLVLVVIPAIILWLTGSFNPGWGLEGWLAYLPAALGLLLLGAGLGLLAATIRLFTRVGQGTLDPMHSGVFITLYGEGLLFGSLPILIFVTIVFVFHWFYIPLTEERWLADQFGEDYQVYKQNVPRWIPRLTPWQGNQVDAQDG
jgi:protein-S-isoprenylcysteine O-methyltransferase Ste14